MSRRILSRNFNVDNDSYRLGLNGHDAIISTSGGGKTSGYVIPNIATCDESIIVTDTKGNLYKKMAPILRLKGYRTELIDTVNPKNSTVLYNPLEWIETYPDGSFSEKDIQSIAALLVPEIKGDKDPFWNNMARVVMEVLIGFTMESVPDEERNLATALEFAREISNPEGLSFLEEIVLINDGGFAAKKLKEVDSLRNSEKTWGCVVAFVHAASAILSSGLGKDILECRHGFDIRTLGDEKTALFINVSDNDRSFDRITDLMYTQFFQMLIKKADNNPDGRLKVPVRMFLDDFGSGCFIPGFENLIAVLRSRNISVSIILQSVTQLYSRYGDHDGNTIINNCDHMIFLGGRDPVTVRYLSEVADCTYDKISNLALGKAVVFERGKKAVFDDAFTWKDSDKLICNIKSEYESSLVSSDNSVERQV